MKPLLLVVLLLAAPAASQAAGGTLYQCVRPDGTVVCTVTDTTGDPSVTCNYECVDCNMVCAARLRVSTQGGQTSTVPETPVKGDRRQPQAPGTVETREYCQQRYQQCVARCRSDPDNAKPYDMDACLSSCNDTLSGCGMKP